MKTSLYLLFILFLLTASCTVEYIAKDENNSPILIEDREGIIQDAIKLKLEYVYVSQSTLGIHPDVYKPLRWMGEDQTKFYTDTIDGVEYAWATTYKKIPLSSIVER